MVMQKPFLFPHLEAQNSCRLPTHDLMSFPRRCLISRAVKAVNSPIYPITLFTQSLGNCNLNALPAAPQGSIANKPYDHNGELPHFISAWAASTGPINPRSRPPFSPSIYPAAVSYLAQFRSDLLGDDKVERWLSEETEERKRKHVSSSLDDTG